VSYELGGRLGSLGSDPLGSDPSSSNRPEVEPAALSEEREREFEQWVRGRLSEWSIADIRAFDGWLLDESHFEFISAVRGAWMRRSLEELDGVDSEEPAA
jgi:hypothetical protein